MRLSQLVVTAATIGFVQRSASTAHAQLTLRDALREVERAGYANRVAVGTAAALRAQTLAPLQGILPSVRVEAGYLNYPNVTVNYQTGVVVEQPLLNASAWTGRRAAVHAADATRALEQWTQVSTRVDVIRAYYGAALSGERVEALGVASRAAHAHVAQAEALVRQGLATKSDALLAAVRAGDVDAQLAEATGAAATTVLQLAVLLGRRGDGIPNDITPAKRLPPTERIRAEVAGDTLATTIADPRADIRAATDALAAARGDAHRAKTSLLPRVNGFARYDRNSASSLQFRDRSWTVGVMASWNPFSGAGERADIGATTAREQVALAQADAVQANAQLEIEQTRITLAVALTRLDIAERATAQSVEARRIVSRKYAGGLAGVVELLDAQAAETGSVLALSQARWSAIVAAAERRRALGFDPASLASLDDTSAIAAQTSR